MTYGLITRHVLNVTFITSLDVVNYCAIRPVLLLVLVHWYSTICDVLTMACCFVCLLPMMHSRHLDDLCCSMDEMEHLAQRNAMLVHGLDWNERRAGIFEPAPTDELAVATTLGLVLNCLSSGLYMVRHLIKAYHCNFAGMCVLQVVGLERVMLTHAQISSCR